MDKTKFCQFEKEANLFERTYNGVPYWQMLRFIVCEGVSSDRIEKSDILLKKEKKKKLLSVVRYVRMGIKSVWNFRKLPTCDMVCFTHNTAQQQEAKFFDYWDMPPNINVLYMKEITDPAELDWNEKYTLACLYVKSRVIRCFRKIFGTTKRDQKEFTFLKELEETLRTRFGKSISAERMEWEILHWIPLDKVSEKYAERFFDKVKCKAIVVVCYYQEHLYAFYRVAKRRNIKIIELQHGVISNHQEYWFEDQRGMNNYTPDYFLGFGQQHIDWTKLLPTTKALPVGFPYQEAQLEAVGPIVTEEKTIIVYPYSDPAFETVIRDFAVAAVPKGYRVIVKLHPSEATDPKLFYPVLTDTPEVEMITDQSKGIYYWLKLGKFHVMADTTVGLEALSLPHTVVCIAEHVPHIQTQPLLDWGAAEGFTTAQQLMQIVESPREKMADAIKSKRKALWQPNAKENMQRFFSEFATEKI